MCSQAYRHNGSPDLACVCSNIDLCCSHCAIFTVTVTTCAMLPVGSAAKSDVLDLTEDTACEVCHCAADAMLLCDKCNRGYHLTCLVPPVASIPPGEWFCQACEAKRASRKGKGTVGIGQKGAAARALVSDSDTDADAFQPAPAATRMTSRQGTLLSKACSHYKCIGNNLRHMQPSVLLHRCHESCVLQRGVMCPSVS